MCSVLCESRWSQDPEGSSMSTGNVDTHQDSPQNVTPHELIMNESKSELCLPASPQYVTRQDSGVPEDLSSPSDKESAEQYEEDDDADAEGDITGNSDCNVTVIHVTDCPTENKDNRDGSDSGVEGCTTEIARVNGCNGSCNGLDEVSCDSSLVSCCSVYEDTCATLPDDLPLTPGTMSSAGASSTSGTLARGNGEGTSEGGSESSSVTGSTSARVVRSTTKRPPAVQTPSSATKKKSTKTESPVKTSRSRPTPPESLSRSKSRGPTPRVTPCKPQATTRDRKNSRDKSLCREDSNSKPWAIPTPSRLRTRSRAIPDSLTLSSTSPLAKEIDKDLAQRSSIRSTSSLSRCSSSVSRGRTTPASTPSEDIRRTLSTPRTSKTLTKSVYTDQKKTDAKIVETKTLEAYATLPRRNKSKMTPLKSEEPKKIVSRETSISTGDKIRNKSVPMFPRNPQQISKMRNPERTIIYHEICVQTGLTGSDIENALAGNPGRIVGPEVPDRIQQEVQTDSNFVSIEELKSSVEKTKKLSGEMESLRVEKEMLQSKLSLTEKLLEEERSDHKFARQELDKNMQRVMAILGTSEQPDGNDSLLELESHFQESGQVVANQQLEIENLKSLCRMMNRDLEKSLAAQKSLLQHQQEVEAESMELQEFLQLEKNAMSEAMKDVENDLKLSEENLKKCQEELERKTEECKHLVRISEQRRQENLSSEMKLNSVERRSRELLLTQGAAVSGAAVALSGLGSRLEGLVEQLVKSYNISEKDLEDVIYHNEAYSKSNSSAECSPISSKIENSKNQNLQSPSPKRNSFVSAVIGAIRNAATHPFVLRPPNKISNESKQIFKELSMDSSAEMLDFETEPCLMMESVLEDVPLPDTYSRNMVSSSDSLRRALSVPEPITNGESPEICRLNDDSSSLNNLSQAILHRRRVEEHEDIDDDDYESVSGSDGTGHNDVNVPTVDYCTAVNLVDQVIDVDNFVTKLLKVLRIIQLENDTCIKELRDEKYELEGKLTEMEVNEECPNGEKVNDI